MEKIESDSLSNRQLISGFEKKPEADSDYRNKSQDDFRKYVDSKFTNSIEQLKSDEKMSLEREKRMMN